ncbi:MAG TPA: hypothetical protein VEI50_00825 [Nitrospiraceae bacterium]|nr:hypothetical protein [Nitrospiraceae bacterium]
MSGVKSCNLAVGLIITGITLTCITLSAGAGYYSKPFEPNMPEGREAYKQAQKDIYPKQVREKPEQYSDQTIAWVGIVKGTEPIVGRSGPAVLVLVEHRYFDWIEDHGAQPEVFFLSPRGEDEFMIVTKPEKQLTPDEAAQLISKGTMVVAVGQIDVRFAKDQTKPLALLTRYVQFIDHKMYRSDVFDYGRRDEAIKKVENGEFWKQYSKK